MQLLSYGLLLGCVANMCIGAYHLIDLAKTPETTGGEAENTIDINGLIQLALGLVLPLIFIFTGQLQPLSYTTTILAIANYIYAAYGLVFCLFYSEFKWKVANPGFAVVCLMWGFFLQNGPNWYKILL